MKAEIDILIEKLTKEGKVSVLSEKESSEIISDIYKGYSEFEVQQKINETESIKELKTINLIN